MVFTRCGVCGPPLAQGEAGIDDHGLTTDFYVAAVQAFLGHRAELDSGVDWVHPYTYLNICVGENIRRCPMPLTSLECQVSKSVDSDACPRPTAGGAAAAGGRGVLHRAARRAARRAGAPQRRFAWVVFDAVYTAWT